MRTKYIILISFLMIFISCDKDFLDRPPLTEPSSATFYTDENSAIMAVNGVYNALPLGNELREWEDALTDNERWNEDGSSAIYGGLAHYIETPIGNNGYHLRSWGNNYMRIARANSAIENIGKMETISDALKNRLIAECKFIRGWSYHLMVLRFGDVPLVLPPTSEQEFLPARTPKSEVLAQIYKDFTEAAQYLPARWTGADIGRIQKGAALGMLSKAYLYQGDWAKAATAAKQVMDMPEYGLIANFLDLWKPGNNNTKEGLFEIQNWTPDGQFSPSYYYRWEDGPAGNTGKAGYGWSMVVQDMVNAFENSDGTPFDPAGRDLTTDNTQYENRDPRLKMSIFCDGMDYFGQPYSRSWCATNNNWRKYTVSKTDPLLVGNNPDISWKVLRLADVILIYAEAKNETDGPVQAVYDAVNQVRNRVGMPNLPVGLSKDQMRERIRNERRVELCSEATRLDDLIRWDKLKEVMEKKHLNPGVNYQITNLEKFRYLWPIPQVDRDVNPNLEQNPGYN